MTSKKSSVNPFRFTFLRTCAKNWLVPLAVFLLTGYTFFVCGFVEAKTTYNVNLFDGNGSSYLEDYKFHLSDDNWGELGFFIDILLIIAAVVLGISIFRYMFSKKSVNVFYSLGMTRKSMFLSKYLAGAFLLTSSVLIPVIADVIGNITLFGSSKELWISAAYLSVCYLSMLLYSYSITVAVCCCVGTLLEAGFFSIVFIGIPMIAEFLLKVLFGGVLYGSPYGRYSDFMLYNGQSYRTEYGFGLASENILFFGSAKYDEYSFLRRSDSTAPFEFENPHLLSLIIMLALILLISFAAFIFYKNRKTEIAGFIGANKAVTHIGIFALSVFGFSFISEYLSYLDYSNKYMAFLFAAVSVFAVYTVIQLVSLRSIKLFFKTIWKMAVHFALLSLIIIVFATGLFGYSTRIPEKSEIERIAITTGTGDSFFSTVRNTSRPYDFLESYMPDVTADAGLKTDIGNSVLLDGYSSEEEIDRILSIHKKLIDIMDADTSSKGVYKEFGERTVLNTTRIIYTLKDGSKLERHYNFSNDEITRMLAELTETELYKKNAVESLAGFFGLTNVYDDAEYVDGIKESAGYTVSPYLEKTVSLASPNFSSLHTAPALNSKNAKTELCEALKEDIMADRLPLNFNTESPVKGYIFVMDLNSDMYISMTEEEAANQYSFHSDNSVINATDAQIVIPVYESMTSTLAVTENYNCISLFENAAEPVAVETWKYNENAKTPYLTERATLVEGIYVNKKEHLMNENFERFWSIDENGEKQRFTAPRLAPDSVESSNPIQIDKFSDAFRMISLDCYEGYYVRLIFEDGSCVYGYAPCSLLD